MDRFHSITQAGWLSEEELDAVADAVWAPKLYAEAEEVILAPQTEVETWPPFSEIKRRSDLSYLAFSYATDKPQRCSG